MKSSTIKFLMAMLILTIACVVMEIIWSRQQATNMRLHYGFLLLGIFVVSVTGIHFYLLNSTKGKPAAFVNSFLATTVFKFFLYIGVLLGFLLLSSEPKAVLILHFIFYYAVFTVVEVSMLYTELKKMKGQ